jgi:hypothetical protein
VLNTNVTGINYTGSRVSMGGLSLNCLVFNYVVSSGDTSRTTIEATAITLANSATITVGGSVMNDANTPLTGKSLMGFGVDKDAPTLLSSSPADGASAVAVDANIALTLNSPISQYISVTSKACSSNVVTLTTAAAHGLDVGDRIAVLQVDPDMDSFDNETYLLASGTAGSTLVYAKTCTTSLASASGGAVAPSRVISIGADADTNKTVTNVVLASNVATLTSASHGFVVGDTVVVDGVAVELVVVVGVVVVGVVVVGVVVVGVVVVGVVVVGVVVVVVVGVVVVGVVVVVVVVGVVVVVVVGVVVVVVVMGAGPY